MLKKIDELPFVNERNAFLLLVAMHTAGIIGLSIESTKSLFQMLTPFNLLATAAILLHFEKNKTPRYFIFILATFVLGYGFEVFGVHTGLLFGEYAYGATLGFKVFEVPLVIGLNWVVLIYITRGVAEKIFSKEIFTILFSSILMVLLDLLIEPVAIKLDFWQWSSDNIPLQNYLGWFLLSVLIQYVGFKILPALNNKLCLRLLLIQFVFFLVLNLF